MSTFQNITAVQMCHRNDLLPVIFVPKSDQKSLQALHHKNVAGRQYLSLLEKKYAWQMYLPFKTWSKYSLKCWDFWSSLHSLPQEHEQLSYSSTRTKAPSVIVSGLKPATWYVFSVRTRTAAGYSSYSPKYEYKTTGDCKYLRPSTTLICCAIFRPKTELIVCMTIIFCHSGWENWV